MKPDEFLLEFLERYSPSYHEKEASDFLLGVARELGLDACQDSADNVVGTIGAGKEVLLFSHIDTIPGRLPVREENGNIYGRGAVDAKGPLTSLLFAASRFVGRELPFKLVFAGVVEEEAPTSLGMRALLREHQPVIGILGEPSSGNGVITGYKGRILVEVRLQSSDTVHASVPGKDNLIEQGLEFWKSFRGFISGFQGKSIFDSVVASLPGIRAGEAANVYPRNCVLTIDIRIPLRISHEEFSGRIQEFCKSEGVKCKISERLNGIVVDKNNLASRSLVSAIRKSGGTPRFVNKIGSSDMNIVHDGFPLVAYGPGDSSLAHSDKEVLGREELLKSIDVLEGAIGGLVDAFRHDAS